MCSAANTMAGPDLFQGIRSSSLACRARPSFHLVQICTFVMLMMLDVANALPLILERPSKADRTSDTHHACTALYSSAVAISRSSSGSEEVDHADSSLARSAEPLHHSVAGTHAGLGESRAMTTRNVLHRWAGEGTPFPAPHPKNKTWPFTQKS